MILAIPMIKMRTASKILPFLEQVRTPTKPYERFISPPN
jgi:hypothetical protein